MAAPLTHRSINITYRCEEASLSFHYWAFTAGPDIVFQRVDMNSAPIDVEGCLIGGDGSGGEHTKDPKIRQCGFGLVALEPETNALGD